MFVLAAFLVFSAALFGTAYYVWVIPREEAARELDARLRGVRSTMRSTTGRKASAEDLLRHERRGAFAFLGDFVGWAALVSRLQVYIQQANLAWRAADVVAISIGIAVMAYIVFNFIVAILLLRLLLALLAGAVPVLIIMRKRNARLKKFEE